MTYEEMTAILNDVDFMNYRFVIGEREGWWFLQATYFDTCIRTGELEKQYTRKWLLSPHMTKSELVQTAFKCCLTSMEHRTREAFKYRGRRIFGPHFNVDELHRICLMHSMDVRPTPDNVSTS